MKRGYVKPRIGISAVQAKPTGAGRHGPNKRDRNRKERKRVKEILRGPQE